MESTEPTGKNFRQVFCKIFVSLVAHEKKLKPRNSELAMTAHREQGRNSAFSVAASREYDLNHRPLAVYADT